jgi:hypothetical protein
MYFIFNALPPELARLLHLPVSAIFTTQGFDPAMT